MSLILLVMQFIKQKQSNYPQQQIVPKNAEYMTPQPVPELTHEEKIKKLHEYQEMMSKVRRMSQKPTIENPNHPLLKRVAEDTKEFKRDRDGITEDDTPRTKKNYKDAYRNLTQEMRLNEMENKKKDEENAKKDELLKNKLNSKPLEFDASVDVVDDVSSLYALNHDGSRGGKNKVDEKLDQQLYWRKQMKIVSAGMIISGLGLFILIMG